MVAHERDLVALYARRMALTESSRAARRQAQHAEDPWSSVELVPFGRPFPQEPPQVVFDEPLREAPVAPGDGAFRWRRRLEIGRASLRPVEVAQLLRLFSRAVGAAGLRLFAVIGAVLESKWAWLLHEQLQISDQADPDSQ